jgi:hypothetical protein
LALIDRGYIALGVRLGSQYNELMAADSSSQSRREIGHVLFLDIAGHSKLLINEQSEQLQKLKEIVRGTEQFRLRAGALCPRHDTRCSGT